jgi:hypothetical protein
MERLERLEISDGFYCPNLSQTSDRLVRQLNTYLGKNALLLCFR